MRVFMIVITQDTVIVFVMMKADRILATDVLSEEDPRPSLLLLRGEGRGRAQSYIGLRCRLCS